MQSSNPLPSSGELMERQCSAKTENKNAKLQTLLIGEVFRTISTYMHSTDNLNFLSCHRDSYNLKSPWITMFSNLQLSTVYGASYPVGSSCEVMRKLILHSLCSLGYNCVRCCMPLIGPNGFFACTNLCTSCSLKTIRESGSRAYVDGSVSQQESPLYFVPHQSNKRITIATLAGPILSFRREIDHNQRTGIP